MSLLKNDCFTLLAGVCLSRFGDTTTSCPVWSEPTGVDCKEEREKVDKIERLVTAQNERKCGGTKGMWT